jgi:hypothetical protein
VSISTQVRGGSGTRELGRRARIFIALCALLIGLGVAAAPARAAFPGANGKLVFSHCDSSACNDSDIVTIDPNGGGATPIVTGTDYTDDPAFSPDGRRIAFEYCPPPFPASGCGIAVVNADGSGRIPLTPIGTVFDDYPGFSPDGSKVVFKRREGSDTHIYTVNSDGSGGLTPLTSGAVTDLQPVFSPDGSKIAFVRSARINVMNADGSGVTPLTTGPNETSPQWSPDGTQIVFERSLADTGQIWIMDAGGGNQHALTAPGTNFFDQEPAFSPDGTRIAFERFDLTGDHSPLMVMNRDGSGITPIPNTDYGYHPDWQPIAPPAATPALAGKAVNGQTLSAQAGAEPPFTTVALGFARCDRSGGGCVAIPNSQFAATSASYKLTSADIGHAIRALQAATNRLGTNIAASAPSKAVAPKLAACSNVFAGTPKKDVFRGTRGGDRFAGRAGNDALSGRGRADCLSGGKGKDRISGGAGKDKLSGGAGKDKITGGKSKDVVSGGPGNDTINVADGKRDRVSCGKGTDSVRADPTDRLRGCEHVVVRV